MAESKRLTEKECSYVICPLGNQLPLCLYEPLKTGKLADILPRDLPMCPGLKNCKTLSEAEKGMEQRNANYRRKE